MVEVAIAVALALAVAYSYVLHYFLTIPVGFNFNRIILSKGLLPIKTLNAIKIVAVYRRSIFQVEWLIVTLIFFVFLNDSKVCLISEVQ